MKAVLQKKGLQLVCDYPRPSPAEGEALVRVTMAGICGTDLEILAGYRGFEGVLGHEFCGVVEEIKVVGPASEKQAVYGSLAGKRVVGEINCGCRICSYCRQGLAKHCRRRSVLGIKGRDGCLAEYVAVPLENLHRVPDAVADEEAVFAEPLASALEITEQVHIKPSARVAVLGDGRLGLLAALVLSLSQAEVTLVGKHPRKLAVVSGLKVKTALFKDLDFENNYDLVVEATGRAGGFEAARKLVGPRGTLILKSTVADKKELDLTPLVIDEITVVGSRCGPFAPALRLLEKKMIDVRPLISALYEFDRVLDAFKQCQTVSPLKVLIDFRTIAREII